MKQIKTLLAEDQTVVRQALRIPGGSSTMHNQPAQTDEGSAGQTAVLPSDGASQKRIMKQIKILLAEDHTVVRQALRILLEAEPDFTVVGEAETGRQAVQLAAKLLPDVIVMDIAMPLLNGLEATRQIKKEVPTTKVLILSSYSDDEYVDELTEAGASGYLLKQTAASDLITAILETCKGNAFFSPAISRRLLEHYREAFLRGVPGQKRADRLTSRETEVLQLIAEGKPNKQIAVQLGVSIKTVQKHRQQMMDKLNIHEIAGLTRYAMTKGIIERKDHLEL